MFLRRRQSGQGMVEYILIIALVALLVVGAMKFFGKKTSDSYEKAGEAIGNAVDKGANSANEAVESE